METLLNDFIVDRPIDETWAVLTDLEQVAPCMPGAKLEEIEGDTYRGVVKVKLGPIAVALKGEAAFVEQDKANHAAVLAAKGRDTGGKGNADATIRASLEPVGPGRTKVIVATDLKMTGKVAQFGRGVMGDVSKKLMAQFADNLNTMLSEQPAAGADPGATRAPAAGAAGAGGAAAAAGAAASSSNGSAGVRKIDGPANEPIELSGVVTGPLLKRLLPALGGLVLLLLVLRRSRKS